MNMWQDTNVLKRVSKQSKTLYVKKNYIKLNKSLMTH